MTERVIRERDALAARLAEPMVIGACITDGRLHATVMRKEANGHVTVLAAAELGVDMLHKRDCLAKLEPAAEPALEIRACGCSQAKNGRCVMGDYGSLPVRTKLYAGTPRPADHLEDVLEMARARPAVTLADEQIRDIVREASPGAATRRDGTTSTRIARAVEAAVLAANGLAGCGACGDACQSRGASRLADESPQIEPARPCRCGPDGCADSQCPGRSAEQCQKQEGGAA
ncbi:hypothetical protein X805_30700 [Sphaerotilus natans subsp. natans DSM 6575]|uniref:Uncharacterized protein n=2 Tax=Sphaerotilus natans TaxID=34103 RepID=A0A059KJD4_9BURK|nr:hypothetical protein X805_30700 [Sphaerotilus natans subsp. natans DSM 6575]